jgi:sulfide:quinone oxidoreductase
VVGAAGAAAYGTFGLNQPISHAKGKVVIVGAGAAGISVAARLSRALAVPQITVIDPSSEHYYQPGFTMIAGGVFTADEVVRSQASLIPGGVTWIYDSVSALDPDHSRLSTTKNGDVAYDFLVLCPGLQIDFEGIPGVRREDLGKGAVHCIYDHQGAQKCWIAIQELAKTGGRAYFTDTWTKIKCGGAPKKINLLTECYCREKGARDKHQTEFFTALDHLLGSPPFNKRLSEIYAERRIPVHYKQRVHSVDIAARKFIIEDHSSATSTLITREFDFLHVVPPMSAPNFVKTSAVAINPKTGKAEDWVPTEPATLMHARYQNVFVTGDVAGIPTSKTSAAIRAQAPVLVANLIAAMENRPPVARYNGYTACPVITEYGKVLLAEFGYEKKPLPTLPLIDPTREHRAGWILKRHVLKPMYFDMMLRGRA